MGRYGMRWGTTRTGTQSMQREVSLAAARKAQPLILSERLVKSKAIGRESEGARVSTSVLVRDATMTAHTAAEQGASGSPRASIEWRTTR
jgi:hypothetical protein